LVSNSVLLLKVASLDILLPCIAAVYTDFNISSEEWEEATNNDTRLRKVTKDCFQTFYMVTHLQDIHLPVTHLLVTHLLDIPLQVTPLLDTPLRDTLLQGTLHRVVILHQSIMHHMGTLHRVVILHQSIMHHMVTLNMGLCQEPILLHMVAIRLQVPPQGILPKGSPQGMAWGKFLLEVQQLQLQLMVFTN
jgi:hypothetical protein